MSKIGVVGAGSFGTALAVVLARANNVVHLWGRDEAQIHDMQASRENKIYLKDVIFPKTLYPTPELAKLAECDVILMVVPAQKTRAVLKSEDFTRIACPVLMCAKGIELGTTNSQTDILNQERPQNSAGVISGPGFAEEIATGKPTALTLAVTDKRLGVDLQNALSTPTLRLYLSEDIKGVQLGGALKNVYAIASGIVLGAGFGESAQAALMTRGFAEMKTLATKMGARPETLTGLSGFGDLVLSCRSMQSRNFAFGYQVGANADFAPTQTVEGFSTALAVRGLAERYGIEMPVCATVAAILQERISVKEALEQLMSRPLKREV